MPFTNTIIHLGFHPKTLTLHLPMPLPTSVNTGQFYRQNHAPFCTHEGSGLANSERDIKAQCPTALVSAGLANVGHCVN